MRSITQDSTGNYAVVTLTDEAGLALTGVAHDAPGLDIKYRIGEGSPVTITLTSGNWFEAGGGVYYVDMPDAAYEATLGSLIAIYGSITDGVVIGEVQHIVAVNPLVAAYGALTTLGTNAPADWINAVSIATDAVTGDKVSASAVTKLQEGLATPTNITAGTITTVTNLTNAPTNGDLTATMKASVNAEVDTALADYDAPTKTEMDTGFAAVPAAVEAAILNEGDATALLAAIAAKVEEFLINEGDATATIAAIAAACNSAIVAGTVGTNVAAVKAKTDNLPASPAAVGSAMTLADGAITAAKFDATTAFPTTSADTGSTRIARTGADADTLKTLSDAIASVPEAILTSGDIDSYTLEETLQICLAALAGKLSGAGGTTITIRSADDTANRIVATVDEDGNRTAVTINTGA